MQNSNENTLSQETTHNRWLVLFAALVASLPVIINMTTLHVAIPTLTTTLSATGTQVLWIIDIYALMMAGLLIPMGTLADRVGARKLLLTGLILFLVASIFASLVSSANLLIVARAATSFGAAMILPSILSTIRTVFADEKERGLALGTWGTVGAAGGAIGPLVGGFLLSKYSWNSVFLINVPLILLIFPLGYLVYPKVKAVTTGKWAVDQALLLVVGLIACIYGVKAIFKADTNVAELVAVFALGATALSVFTRMQYNSANPLLDISLLKEPAIRVGVILALVVCAAMAGVEFTIAQEMQFVFERSPLQAASVMLPLMLATGVGGPIAGLFVGRFGVRLVATGSLLVSAASLGMLAASNFSNINLIIIISLILLGLSLAVGLTSSSIAIMNTAPPDKAGAAGSIETVGYELGMGLGITIFGLLLSATYRNTIQVPVDLAGTLAKQATLSIGDTMIAAKQLETTTAEALMTSAKVAFSSAHQTVLATAAILIAVVAISVFVVLGKTNRKNASH